MARAWMAAAAAAAYAQLGEADQAVSTLRAAFEAATATRCRCSCSRSTRTFGRSRPRGRHDRRPAGLARHASLAATAPGGAAVTLLALLPALGVSGGSPVAARAASPSPTPPGPAGDPGSRWTALWIDFDPTRVFSGQGVLDVDSDLDVNGTIPVQLDGTRRDLVFVHGAARLTLPTAAPHTLVPPPGVQLTMINTASLPRSPSPSPTPAPPFGPGFHWRLWVPVFGFGIPTRTYVRQGLRTLGCNLGLSLGGTVVVVLLGNLLTAR